MKWVLIREDNGIKIDLTDASGGLTVGRGKECFIKCLSLYASRYHCDLIYEEDKLYVVDLKSSNGTFVNGHRIPVGKKTILNENDFVGVGVPEILDSKSVIYKVVKEKDELSATAINLAGNRKRNLLEPVSPEQIPSKVICLDDVQCSTSSSSKQLNNIKVVERESVPSSNSDISRTASVSSTSADYPIVPVTARIQTSTDITVNESASVSHNADSTHPVRQIVTEFIDLVESDEEVQIKKEKEDITYVSNKEDLLLPENKDPNVLISMNNQADVLDSLKNKSDILSKSIKKQNAFPSVATNSGYADENDVIVISDDEDMFFSSSMISDKGDNVEEEENMYPNGMEETNEKELQPEKSWDVSDSESDNEWWPKLSQSFTENTQEEEHDGNEVDTETAADKTSMCKMETEVEEVMSEKIAPHQDDEVGLIHSDQEEGDDKFSNDEDDDDYKLCIDEKGGDDDDKGSNEGDEDIDEEDDDKEEEKSSDDEDEESAFGNWFPVLSQGFYSDEEEGGKYNEIPDEKINKHESADGTLEANKEKVEIAVDSIPSVSTCTDIRISESEVFENKSCSIQIRNDLIAEPKDDRVMKIHNKEPKLSLSSREKTRGPLLVEAPTLKRGNRCIWEDTQKKYETPSHDTNICSTSLKRTENVDIIPCSVVLEKLPASNIEQHDKNIDKLTMDRKKFYSKNNNCYSGISVIKSRKNKILSTESLSKEEKRKIKEERKAKLQALSDKGLKDETVQSTKSHGKEVLTGNNKPSTSKSQVKDKIPSTTEGGKDCRPGKVVAKVTSKNRGAFLTEFDLFSTNTVGPIKKSKPKKSIPSKFVIPLKKNQDLEKELDQVLDAQVLENLPSTSQCLDLKSLVISDEANIQSAPSNVNLVKPIRGILKRSDQEKKVGKLGRKVSFKESHEVRFFAVQTGVNLAPVRGKDYPLSPLQLLQTSGIMMVVYDICRWNVQWLEEQRSKPSSQPPPVHHNYRLVPMVGSYSSYQEYYSSYYPLMMYEIWAKVYKEWDQNSTRNQITQVLLQSQLTTEIQPNGQDFAQIIGQCMVNSNEKMENYPKYGDLCILELPEQRILDGKENIVQPSIVIARVFAFVESVKRTNFSSRINVNQCSGYVEKPAYTLNISLKLKKRTQQICIGVITRLRVVCQLMTELRNFEALLELPNSPLVQHILNPIHLRTTIPGNIRIKSTDKMNASQQKAIYMAKQVCLSEKPSIGLIQGPPGTGKTRVIVTLLMELFESYGKTLSQVRRRNKTPRVLLCAPSNAAIDNLVIKLLGIRTTLDKENRFRLVRVGRLESMNPAVRDISLQELALKELNSISANSDEASVDLQLSTIEAKINSSKLALECARNRDDPRVDILERRLNENLQKLEEAKKVKHTNGSGMSNRERREKEATAERNLLRCADIVATTLASSVNSAMVDAFPLKPGNKSHFSCCIIDEACQSLEADTLIPLKLGVSNLVLVGDQEQLYPTVLSMVAKQNGLQTSLFERLWSCLSTHEAASDFPMVRLNVQYRMHPEICLWPNISIYNGILETPPDLVMERQSPFLPYVVISLDFDQNDPKQLLNCSEAEMVSKLYFAIQEKTEKRRYSIGVITPYQKQKVAIEAAIAKRRSIKDVQCEVNTIDSFQGQEKDIIILSCVRSYGIGFLGERRRINVALTRARRSLIVCGNFTSLKDHELWNAFLANGLSRGVVKCVSGSNVPNQKDLLNLVLRNH